MEEEETVKKEVRHEAPALPPHAESLLTWTHSVPYVQPGENTLINSKDLL